MNKLLAFLMLPLCAFAARAGELERLAVLGGSFSPRLPDSGVAAPAPLQSAVSASCPKSRQDDKPYYEITRGLIRGVSPVSGGHPPAFADDMDAASMQAALRNSLAYWNRRPDGAQISVGGKAYNAAHLRKSTARLLELFAGDDTADKIGAAIKKEFDIFESVADDGSNQVVITGYYQADIPVVRRKDAAHPHALYKRPPELARSDDNPVDDGGLRTEGSSSKYYTTEEISNGALAGRNLELAWSAHPAEIMLLQIQGSGFARLADGSAINIGYDGNNGQPFKSVQRILMDCGEIGSMSFSDFINYLTSLDNGRETRIVNLNPRYVFFKETADAGAHGALDEDLTGGRSVAIDPAYVPLGLAGLLISQHPVADGSGHITGFESFTRFIATQDTGSAIRGPGRVDLFWGAGKKAETEASAMKAPGKLYLFVLKK
ncbi:MAG: MltA domain-containing protein [Elusimicrobiales bacterium]|nr:MltA domain-containing protein [Elusimicrobiales bacterium]